MIMDPGLPELSGLVNSSTVANAVHGFRLEAPRPSFDHNDDNVGVPNDPAGPAPNENPPAPARGDSAEDPEIFSSIALNYISQMLMEEDIDEKMSMLGEESALRAAEKPFYDILGQKYPPSPDQPPCYSNYSSESADDNGGGSADNSWAFDAIDYRHSQIYPANLDYLSQSSFSSSSTSAGNVVESLDEPLLSPPPIFPGLFTGNQLAWQFRRGVEEARKFLPTDKEARKFLPSDDKLVIDLESNGFLLPQELKVDSRLVEVKAEEDGEYLIGGSRGRKNPYSEDLDLEEGRSRKQSAVSFEDTLRSEMFDSVLLSYEGKYEEMLAFRESLLKEASKNSQNGNSKGSNGGKGRGKKQPKKEVADLRTLLILCAQAVAADDRRIAHELLKQIRQHSSPFGDGSQRLAHYFADGLEARLAGKGSQIYHSLEAKRITASEILKAFHLYLAATPFKTISHFYANEKILDVSKKASRIHIVDFGIFFGFQWPCLIQRLSTRPGGPPKLRITGIDVPLRGFRPTERIEETGRRLAVYAQSFNVPFEYHSISSKWEIIRVEDLKIDRDEVLIVNCMYRFRNIVDETMGVDSPRDKVLNTIRRMNPDLFVLGIMNGSYSAPFFVTRFREALFHFSALFDMLEMNVPREDAQRLLIERGVFGQEAFNVISCEGSERVERPETYKQWQVRNLRAGFDPLQLDPALMKKVMQSVKGSYHKDFDVDEDRGWLLQGWKGRISHALSTWKPQRAC